MIRELWRKWFFFCWWYIFLSVLQHFMLVVDKKLFFFLYLRQHLLKSWWKQFSHLFRKKISCIPEEYIISAKEKNYSWNFKSAWGKMCFIISTFFVWKRKFFLVKRHNPHSKKKLSNKNYFPRKSLSAMKAIVAYQKARK